ncbi:MAG TPA: hypothetical protein VLA04_01210 [Verrucomicrobiae bacterium]|nr:hypothetical protein [Verrucomicrobiae bacterium]
MEPETSTPPENQQQVPVPPTVTGSAPSPDQNGNAPDRVAIVLAWIMVVAGWYFMLNIQFGHAVHSELNVLSFLIGLVPFMIASFLAMSLFKSQKALSRATLAAISLGLIFGLFSIYNPGVLDPRDPYPAPSASATPTPSPTPLTGKEASVFTIKDEAGVEILNGEDITSASAGWTVNGLSEPQPQITFTLLPSSWEKFAKATRENIGKTLPVYVKGKLIAEPLVVSSITEGELMVTGDFSEYEAQELAASVNYQPY